MRNRTDAWRAICALVIAALCLAGCSGSAATSAASSSASSAAVEQAAQAVELPSSFDLRAVNVDGQTVDYVTPVKYQNPWSTCWAFTAIAAAEVSIATENGLDYVADRGDGVLQNTLDLSELALAWFANTTISQANDDFSAQVGEGNVTEGANPLDAGGYVYMAASLFAAGVGPIDEAAAPYRNAEGEIEYNSAGEAMNYSSDGDWSVSEDLRFTASYQLSNCNVLPSPTTGYTGETYVYDASATEAIKREVAAGRAVAVSLYADASSAGDIASGNVRFINAAGGTWAQYAYTLDGTVLASDHAGCIVGWDDSYSASNFLEGREPPGDGAWIVKNTWGSADQEFPNNAGGWGIDGTGYYYVSYYDMSLGDPTSFEFEPIALAADETSEVATESGLAEIIDQHDFVPVMMGSSSGYDEPLTMASVFTAGEDQSVVAISVQTPEENTQVDVRLVRLGADAGSDAAASLSGATVVYEASSTVEHAGVHRIDLTTPIGFSAGERFAVLLRERSEDGVYLLAASGGLGRGNAEQLEDGGQVYSSAIVGRGECYTLLGDESTGMWVDWTDTVAQSLGDSDEYVLDDLPIKAYAVKGAVQSAETPAGGSGEAAFALPWKAVAIAAEVAVAVAAIACAVLVHSRRKRRVR